VSGLALWIAGALAADFAVVAEDDELRPGLPGTVWVATLDDMGGRPPAVEASGGSVRFGLDGASDGVWPLIVTPSLDSDFVELAITAPGERSARIALDVGWPDPGELEVPARVEAVVQSDQPIRIPIRGARMPPAELLDVVVGEGVVRAVEEVEGGLEVVVEAGDSPFPRLIPFGVRDARTDDRPSWGTIRLRARPRIPLEAEPGATLELVVGGRRYGPFQADEAGRIVARVDQYPGETSADAVLIDDLGNQTASTIPLATNTVASLVAMPGARSGVLGRPRVVYLRAVAADGRAWRGVPPSCRSPARGALEVARVNAGLFAVPIEGRLDGRVDRDADAPVDVRLECRLGSEAAASIRLGPPPGVASRLLLQVWPTEMSTDLPLAEVRAAVEDTRGQRLDPGELTMVAEHGELVGIQKTEAGGLEAEYRGEQAVDVGRDRIVVRYTPEPTEGPVVHLDLGWDRTGPGFAVRGRALDARGAPVEGVEVAFRVRPDRLEPDAFGPTTQRATTDASGWAEIQLEFGPPGPLVLEGRVDGASARALVMPGTRGPISRSNARLEVDRVVTLSPGRVAGISVNVDPPILRTGRGAVAWVSVQLEDRAGNAVTEEGIELEVSEGEVGALLAQPDGTWLAEYIPVENDRAREVTITARTDALRSTARLTLEPRLGRFALGPNVGWISNFGSISSPTLGFDVDWRTRLLAETVLLRASVTGYGVTESAETGFGDDVELQGTVLPFSLAVLLRQDRGGWSFWGGAGGILGMHTLTSRFGDQIVSRGNRAISGGTVMGGAGYRLGVGDLVVEARYAIIPGPGGELGFTGNIGGLAAGLGFRLVY
jgi:hypothetical protein